MTIFATRRVRRRYVLAVAVIVAVTLALLYRSQAAGETGSGNLFPYAYFVDDLPNGLRLVTVPTDYPNMVALYVVVRAGSRDEVESGKSGYAHLFEHLMFRGSENYTPEQRDALMKRAGADTNASTNQDRTTYYAVFSKEDLDGVLAEEADRFQRLKYSEPAYKTESLAVLGEYNKNSSEPLRKLDEVLSETAFKHHTYAHTTMGYLQDIQDMPNQYAYSLEFYKRFYRPEYVTVVVVGDVARDATLALTRKYFGGWTRGSHVPAIPPEPPQMESRTAHVEWPSPTLPWVVVAFKGPAYSDEAKDKVALDLFSEVAFGPNSELYRRLVLEEQKVDELFVDFANHPDPELFTVYARIKNANDMDSVRDRVLSTFARFTNEAVDQAKLDATRSRIRYSFALRMNSSPAIAASLAPYILLRRTPDTINKVFALYQQVTPQDIRTMAAKYFTETNRTIVTLASKTGTK
jgi:zinc protease